MSKGDLIPLRWWFSKKKRKDAHSWSPRHESLVLRVRHTQKQRREDWQSAQSWLSFGLLQRCFGMSFSARSPLSKRERVLSNYSHYSPLDDAWERRRRVCLTSLGVAIAWALFLVVLNKEFKKGDIWFVLCTVRKTSKLCTSPSSQPDLRNNIQRVWNMHIFTLKKYTIHTKKKKKRISQPTWTS